MRHALSVFPMVNRSTTLNQFMNEGQLCACANLRKAVRAVSQLYDDAFRPIGLRATQFGLLGATGMLGPLTINRLAEAIVMDRTTLTRNLRPLEKQGLLQIKSGKDRREREVSITRRGQVVLAKGYPLWKKAQGIVVKGLGQERVSRLLKDLSAVVAVAQRG